MNSNLFFIVFTFFVTSHSATLDHAFAKRQAETITQSTLVETVTQSSIKQLIYIEIICLVNVETCPAEQLTSSHLTTLKILMYITSGWITAWCMLSSVVNIIFK